MSNVSKPWIVVEMTGTNSETVVSEWETRDEAAEALADFEGDDSGVDRTIRYDYDV